MIWRKFKITPGGLTFSCHGGRTLPPQNPLDLFHLHHPRYHLSSHLHLADHTSETSSWKVETKFIPSKLKIYVFQAVIKGNLSEIFWQGCIFTQKSFPLPPPFENMFFHTSYRINHKEWDCQDDIKFLKYDNPKVK